MVRLQTAPEDIDPFSVEAIRLANPAFDVFMNQKKCWIWPPVETPAVSPGRV